MLLLAAEQEKKQILVSTNVYLETEMAFVDFGPKSVAQRFHCLLLQWAIYRARFPKLLAIKSTYEHDLIFLWQT